MQRTDIDRSADAQLAGRLAEALGDRGPLTGLTPPLRVQIIRLGELLELAPGEPLIREDEDAVPEVYVLVEGTLAVRARTGMTARLTRPGDVVGEVAVLLSSKRTADVVAEDAVRVLAIPAKVLAMPEYAEVSAAIGGAMIRDDWVQY